MLLWTSSVGFSLPLPLFSHALLLKRVRTYPRISARTRSSSREFRHSSSSSSSSTSTELAAILSRGASAFVAAMRPHGSSIAYQAQARALPHRIQQLTTMDVISCSASRHTRGLCASSSSTGRIVEGQMALKGLSKSSGTDICRGSRWCVGSGLKVQRRGSDSPVSSRGLSAAATPQAVLATPPAPKVGKHASSLKYCGVYKPPCDPFCQSGQLAE